MSTPIYPRDAARMLGIHVKTLQKWDTTGILKANRTVTGRRWYTQEQILAHLQVKAEGI